MARARKRQGHLMSQGVMVCPAVGGPEVAALDAVERAKAAVAALGAPGWQGEAADAYRAARDEDVALLAALAGLVVEAIAAMAAHRAARQALAASLAGAPALASPLPFQPWGSGLFQSAGTGVTRPTYGLVGVS